MEIKKFNEYEPINEEFIGGLIKGALGKLAGLFSAPFKDLANDFKKMFKEDDPNSLKSVVMTNVNQAIDGAQKEINNLQDETAVIGVMDNMVNTLIQLGQNVGKDIETAFGKDKAQPIKKNYIDQVNKAKDIKTKKSVANKFFDDLQKNLQAELDKDFTEEEIKKAWDDAKKKTGQDGGEMTYDKLKELFDKKTPVIYLLKDKKKEEYDDKKKPGEQANIVGVKPIDSLNDQNKPDSVVFLDKDGKPTIKKSYAEIIGPGEAAGDNAKKAAEVLGKIKQDEEKMAKVVKFAEFMQDDKNKDKVTEIEKMMGA